MKKNAKRVSEAMNNIRTLVLRTEKNLNVKKASLSAQKRDYGETVKKMTREMKNQNPFADDNTYKSYDNVEIYDETL